MPGPIRIELVKIRGHYVGRSTQDRWNLQALDLIGMEADRNQTAIKRARRSFPEFVFVVVRSTSIVQTWSRANADALTVLALGTLCTSALDIACHVEAA
jgi:hypothetical protein